MAEKSKASGKDVIQSEGKGAAREKKLKKAKEKRDVEQDEDELELKSLDRGDATDEKKAPLFEQPLEVVGARMRKPVDRLDSKAESLHQEELGKKRHEILPGCGEKLGTIIKIVDELRVMKTHDLYLLHRLLFKRRGTSHEIKKNIKEFSGFPFEKHEKEFGLRKATLEKASVQDVKLVCRVLHLERGGTKPEIIDRVMEFLLHPKQKDVDKSNASPKSHRKKGKGKSGKDGPTDDDAGSAKEVEATHGSADESNDEEPQPPKKRKKGTFPRKGTTTAAKKAKTEDSGLEKGEQHFDKEGLGEGNSSAKEKEEEEEILKKKSSKRTQEVSDLKVGNDAEKPQENVEKEPPEPKQQKGRKLKSKQTSAKGVDDESKSHEEGNTASKPTKADTIDAEEVNEAPVKKRNAKMAKTTEKNKYLEREEIEGKGKLKDDDDEDAVEEEAAMKKTVEAAPVKAAMKTDKKKHEKGNKISTKKKDDKEKEEEEEVREHLPATLKKTQETHTVDEEETTENLEVKPSALRYGNNKRLKDIDKEPKSVSEEKQKANKSARKDTKVDQIAEPSGQADKTGKHNVNDKPKEKTTRKEKANVKTEAETVEKDDVEEHQEVGKHEKEAQKATAHKRKVRNAKKETKDKEQTKKNEDLAKKAESDTSAEAEMKDINNGEHEACEPKRKNDAKEVKKARQVTFGNEGDELVSEATKSVPTDEEILGTIKQITGQVKEGKPPVKTVFQSVLEQYPGVDLSKKKKNIEANIRKLLK